MTQAIMTSFSNFFLQDYHITIVHGDSSWLLAYDTSWHHNKLKIRLLQCNRLVFSGDIMQQRWILHSMMDSLSANIILVSSNLDDEEEDEEKMRMYVHLVPSQVDLTQQPLT